MKRSTVLFSISLSLFGYAGAVSLRLPGKAPEVSYGRDVRPILSEHCFKCHGPDVGKAAAGLRFDSYAHATVKLGDGAAIVPGKPQDSRILDRVAEKDLEMRMPPPDAGVSALTPAQIATLRAWIAQGAHYEKHWSFVPPVLPRLPQVSNPKWAKNLVDTFVMERLDRAGLRPESEVDRDTLALRAAQTLTGLPPTDQELGQFRRDAKPGAYERYVDRLLAKPEYGEHQARYWLDAVRYGDTHGLQLDNERGIYPYRDWVIQAFNQDLPYDQFVKWQLAGDMLQSPTTQQLVATGFVRMNLTTNEGGAIPEEFLARNTFDRVDTTSMVLLGLTVGCAKCHDHKYDPIKQRDYYGLYAYFNSTQDAPLDGNIALPPPYIRATTPEQDRRVRSLDAQLAALRNRVAATDAVAYFNRHQSPPPSSRNWQISPVYASANFDAAFDELHPGEPGQPPAIWKPFAFEPGKDAANIIGQNNASVYVRGTVNLPAPAQLTMQVASDDGVKVWLNGALIHSHKVGRGLTDPADLVKGSFRAGDNELVAKVVNGIGPDGLNIRFAEPNGARTSKAIAKFKMKPTGDHGDLQDLYLESGPLTKDASAYRSLQKEKVAIVESAPMTLIAREMPKPRPTKILKRGQYDQPGDLVERHIPPSLVSENRKLPKNRLGLAQWMVDPANPLVARVFVNRLWQQHFGVGIVKTSDDFGNQGEWPLNQPLLDYLAVSFVKHQWSVKQLNRLIVTSAAFRQSSKISAQKLAKDPENRLISRGPRFRLDAEVIRDKALDASGLLVRRVGGHGVKPYQPDGLWEGSSDPASSTHVYMRDRGQDLYRRSLYMFWKRTSPPPMMVTFDAPLRDTCIVRRSSTDTPLQALAVLNETAFLESCRSLAVRVLAAPGSDEQRLRRMFDWTLARPPHAGELSLLKRSLARYRRVYANPKTAKELLNVGDAPQNLAIPASEQAAWMILGSTLTNTDEFLTQH